MLVGIPKETKIHEYRVGLTPESVREVVAHGHRVLVETDAGAGIGATDADYRAAGAGIAETAPQVFAEAELIVNIKEPLAPERARHLDQRRRRRAAGEGCRAGSRRRRRERRASRRRHGRGSDRVESFRGAA